MGQSINTCSKEIGVAGNADETKYVAMSCEQNAGHGNIKTVNKSSESVGNYRYLETAPVNQNCRQEQMSGSPCCH